MSRQPTYILAPNFHFKPGNGPIALGNIISDPLRPHRALTTIDSTILENNYPRVETFTDYDRSVARGKQHDISMNVWTQFMQTVSAKIEGGHGSEIQTKYTMESLQTVYFVADPALEEIEERLKAPRVQAVMRSSRIPGMWQPVYMVTGLMIAQGFSTEQQRGTHRKAEIQLGAEAPTPAGQVGAGVGLARIVTTEEADNWRAGEDIVFAYQLLKIEIKGWKGKRIEYDELRHKAAYLSNEDSEETDEEEEETLGQVVISATTADILPASGSRAPVTVVDMGESDNLVTCISINEM